MLVNCVAYQNGRKLADIPIEDISEYVSRPDCFVWVAIADPDGPEMDTLAEEFGLHELAVEDAKRPHQRPKLDEYGEDLFAVIRTVERESPDGELIEGQVGVFVGRNYVLSVRQNVRKGFADVRERTEREPDLLRHGSGYVLYALMDAIVDRYFPTIDTLEEELEQIEERIFAGGAARTQVEALYGIKQKLVILKHAVAPLLEATSKLHGGRVPQICAGMGEYFRDVYDHLARLNQSIDSIRDMVTMAMSVHLSLSTMQENETTKRLAAYAALVAVPTMIAGLYGMNFENMPELRWNLGYPVTLLVMAAIDIYLFYRFRKTGWL